MISPRVRRFVTLSSPDGRWYVGSDAVLPPEWLVVFRFTGPDPSVEIIEGDSAGDSAR